MLYAQETMEAIMSSNTWIQDPFVTRRSLLSISMLTVLETLAPAERAVFVLREFYDLRDDDIAAALDRRPAVVRQIAFRAREHVATLSR
jgi:DNA-directed RNA polymerase specialized sigma24 family protein